MSLRLALFACFLILGAVNAAPGFAETDDRTISLRMTSFTPVLHPHKLAESDSRRIASALHVGLIARDNDGSFHPRLAKSWRRRGERTFVFELEDNLTFSNGHPVTARDVVESLCRLQQPGSPYAWVLASLRHEATEDGTRVKCTGLAAENDRTIAITESEDSTTLLEALASPPAWIIPADPGPERPYGVVPGAGPYEVEEIVADSRIVLKARPGGPVRPGADFMVFNYLPDDAVAAAKFRRGELDFLEVASPTLEGTLFDRSDGRPVLNAPGTMLKGPVHQMRFALINKQALIAKQGFTERQADIFVQAYKAAVDRERIMKIAGDLGKPLYTAFFPRNGKVTKPAMKDTIDVSGLPVAGLPVAGLTVLTASDPYSDRIAAALPSRIGNVTIDYRGTDPALLIQSLVSRDYDIASIALEAVMDSPFYWASFFRPSSPFVVFGLAIPELERVDLRTKEGLAEAQKLIDAKGNWVPLFREVRLFAVGPRIEALRFTSTGHVSFETVRIRRAGAVD